MPAKQTLDDRATCTQALDNVLDTMQKALEGLPESNEEAVAGTRSTLLACKANVIAELDVLGWHAKHANQPGGGE